MLVDPDTDEEGLGRVIDRVRQIVSEHGGEVSSVDTWGRRKLAYEIDRKAEGTYFVASFQAEPGALTELDRVLSLADEVMRFKTVRADAA